MIVAYLDTFGGSPVSGNSPLMRPDTSSGGGTVAVGPSGGGIVATVNKGNGVDPSITILVKFGKASSLSVKDVLDLVQSPRQSLLLKTARDAVVPVDVVGLGLGQGEPTKDLGIEVKIPMGSNSETIANAASVAVGIGRGIEEGVLGVEELLVLSFGGQLAVEVIREAEQDYHIFKHLAIALEAAETAKGTTVGIIIPAQTLFLVHLLLPLAGLVPEDLGMELGPSGLASEFARRLLSYRRAGLLPLLVSLLPRVAGAIAGDAAVVIRPDLAGNVVVVRVVVVSGFLVVNDRHGIFVLEPDVFVQPTLDPNSAGMRPIALNKLKGIRIGAHVGLHEGRCQQNRHGSGQGGNPGKPGHSGL